MTKTYFVWFALIVAAAAVAAVAVSQWDKIFSPKDYEECAESAAKQARSKEALSILISSCDTKFVGRRKPGGGGYSYFDFRQNRSFDIAGPNPTEREKKFIEAQYSLYIESKIKAQKIQDEIEAQKIQDEIKAQKIQDEMAARRQLAIESRRIAAIKSVKVISSNVECRILLCNRYKLFVRVKNQSTENITAISLGWVFLSQQETSCPSTLSTKRQLDANLRPGDTTVFNIDGFDGSSYSNGTPCVMVTDVTIVP
jgi:hypothetical protein